jgi:3-dehydroquinate synthase
MAASGASHIDGARLVLPNPQGETVLLFGNGLCQSGPPAELARLLAGRTVFALSTPALRQLHGERIAGLLAPAGRVVELEAPDGESAKTLAEADRLWRQMLEAGGKRDSLLLAVGGGSLTDLGGFVAGAFLRGIDVVHVPTTFLAMVDAAIGGKTAIDLPQAKNSVGLFHHPKLFLADTDFLASLPADELRSGLVEAIKMAAMLGPELLARIEEDLPALLRGSARALLPVVAGAAAAKCWVVERDPSEQNLRKVLNFGHTLGHAIEGVLGFSGLRHGEAIAYGILFTLMLQQGRPDADPAFLARLHQLLARLELPPLPLGPAQAGELIGFMARDKKASEKGLTWVLPTRLGEHQLRSDLGREQIAAALGDFLSDPWARSQRSASS